MIEKLTREHYCKLSASLKVSVHDLQKLNAHKLLSVTGALDHLILCDWLLLRQETNLSSADILTKLTKRYDCSLFKVKQVVYGRRLSLRQFCEVCGAPILRSVQKRNLGLCDKCKKIRDENVNMETINSG